MRRVTNDRILGLVVLAIVLLSVLWVRCLWIQILASKRYKTIIGERHYAARRIPARRGDIYDRAKRILATSIPVPSVYANARGISDKKAMAKRLADIVDENMNDIKKRLERDKGFVWIARQVAPARRPELVRLRRSGIGIVDEPKRFYPYGRLASHLLGFVDIDHEGLEGLELKFHAALQGADGWRETLLDARRDLLIGPWTAQAEPLEGLSMVLTIDAVVQQAAEDTLDWGIKRYNAKGGSIVALAPETGAVLAMASRPGYDPNFPTRSPAENRRNRAITDLFEPGSVFKVVTAAALLNEERITPEDIIYCEEGQYPTVGRHILHDHSPHGKLPFKDVIRLSSNIGIAKAAQRLSPDELYSYIRAFGFGSPTGIDFPGEVSGMIKPPHRWSKLSPFIIPMGQEIAVTPIQLAVMMAVVANGGFRVKPYLVDHFEDDKGRIVHVHRREQPEQVLKAYVAEELQKMLVRVVESGTGHLANVQGLTVAGKTGTAQKLELNGHYSHSCFVASFVGFAPVSDSQRAQQFVIAISVDEPKPVHFGGLVAAPMFARMVRRLANYLELRPRNALSAGAIPSYLPNGESMAARSVYASRIAASASLRR